MAFVVEDGTGLTEANAGVSVEFADNYHAERGNAAWAELSTEVKQQLIIKATDYVELTFFAAWNGHKYLTTQGLASYPRVDDYRRALPYAGIQKSIAELALIAHTTPLMPNAKRGKKMVKVGPVQVEYDPAQPTQTKFVQATLWLAPYLNGYASSSVNTRLARR